MISVVHRLVFESMKMKKMKAGQTGTIASQVQVARKRSPPAAGISQGRGYEWKLGKEEIGNRKEEREKRKEERGQRTKSKVREKMN